MADDELTRIFAQNQQDWLSSYLLFFTASTASACTTTVPSPGQAVTEKYTNQEF